MLLQKRSEASAAPLVLSKNTNSAKKKIKKVAEKISGTTHVHI